MRATLTSGEELYIPLKDTPKTAQDPVTGGDGWN